MPTVPNGTAYFGFDKFDHNVAPSDQWSRRYCNLYAVVKLEPDPEFSSSPPKRIKHDGIRLAVFDDEKKRLVYDTDTIVYMKDPLPTGSHFQFLRHKSDVSQLRTMVFGTMPTTKRKGTLKVHTLHQTNNIVLSRVFAVPKYASIGGFQGFNTDPDSSSQYYSTIRSLDAIHESQYIRIPTTGSNGYGHRNRNSSLQIEADEFRPLSFNPGRLGHLRRSQISFVGLASEFPKDEMEGLSMSDSKQMGVAIIFDLDERDFLFKHIMMIEDEIDHLQEGVADATQRRKNDVFLTIYNSYQRFCQSICALHNSARLRIPAWLSLTEPLLQTDTAVQFCQKFCSLIRLFDTKEKNYFISTLLTAVLSNHLTWVSSVAAPNRPPTTERSLLIGTTVVDARNRPYNPHIAQFMELFGSVGELCRSVKTVLVGEDSRLITDILFVLSYFIRCSSVKLKQMPSPPPPPPESPPSTVRSDDMDEVPPECPTMASPAASNPFIRHGTRVVSKRPSSSISNSQQAAASPPVLPSSVDSEEMAEPPPKSRAIIIPSSSGGSSAIIKINSPTYGTMDLILDTVDINESGTEIAWSRPPPVDALSPSSASSVSSSTAAPNSQTQNNELSRSLLAGVCDEFVPHFVLSGVHTTELHSTDDVIKTIYAEVRHGAQKPCFSHLYTNAAANSRTTSAMGSNSSVANSTQSPPRGFRTPNRVTRNPSDVAPHSQTSPHSQESRRSQLSDHPTEVKPHSAANIIVLGDTNDFSIRTVFGEEQSASVDERTIDVPGESVVRMCEKFAYCHEIGCDPNFLIDSLEDALRSIVAKSQTFVHLLSSMNAMELDEVEDEDDRMGGDDSSTTDSSPSPPKERICSGGTKSLHVTVVKEPTRRRRSKPRERRLSFKRVAEIVGCDSSDLTLILNVASVYAPEVLSLVH